MASRQKPGKVFWADRFSLSGEAFAAVAEDTLETISFNRLELFRTIAVERPQITSCQLKHTTTEQAVQRHVTRFRELAAPAW